MISARGDRVKYDGATWSVKATRFLRVASVELSRLRSGTKCHFVPERTLPSSTDELRRIADNGFYKTTEHNIIFKIDF